MTSRWTIAAAAALLGASCTGGIGSQHTASTTTCGVWLSAELPGGGHLPLTSCAGLAGITPSEAQITLKVGQTVTITAAASSAGVQASDLTSDTPAVLVPGSTERSETPFTARSAGTAEILITTGACTVHNGTLAPCPVAPVKVIG